MIKKDIYLTKLKSPFKKRYPQKGWRVNGCFATRLSRSLNYSAFISIHLTANAVPLNKTETPTFFNFTFDKGRLKNLVSWTLEHYGQYKTVELLEQLKKTGFEYATKAGISLGIDDLKIPPKKKTLLLEAEKLTKLTVHQYQRGDITAVERFQRLIDTWHRTSEQLKQEVITHFEETDILNPVYMMAFSGARGNISQVRQLVGMRGLMSDPQGQIIDFPIRSNFREGLTLTEYIISSYGARKGIVDTALRTANAGYLTRRLVDVAQHVIISHYDCGTQKGIFLTDMKEGNKTIVSAQSRIIGRVLARDIYKPNTTSSNIIVASRNQEISTDVAFEITKITNRIFVRSSLTCNTTKLLCQLCYGWSLAQGNLVSVGEAVGVIAAQSIGEPGTQLTMRTFHTGGVFSGDVSDEIRAPYNGFVHYGNTIPGILIRALDGKILFLTKSDGTLIFSTNPTLDQQVSVTPDIKKFKIPAYTVLFIRNGESVFQKQVVAQITSIRTKPNMRDTAELVIKSELEGLFYAKNLQVQKKVIGPKPKFVGEAKQNLLLDAKAMEIVVKARGWNFAWVLSGKRYELPLLLKSFPIIGDFITPQTVITRHNLKVPSSYTLKLNITNIKQPLNSLFPNKTQKAQVILFNKKFKSLLSQLIIERPVFEVTPKASLSTQNIKMKQDLLFLNLKKIKYHKIGYFHFFNSQNFKSMNSLFLQRTSTDIAPSRKFNYNVYYNEVMLSPTSLKSETSLKKSIALKRFKSSNYLLEWFSSKTNTYKTFLSSFVTKNTLIHQNYKYILAEKRLKMYIKIYKKSKKNVLIQRKLYHKQETSLHTLAFKIWFKNNRSLSPKIDHYINNLTKSISYFVLTYKNEQDINKSNLLKKAQSSCIEKLTKKYFLNDTTKLNLIPSKKYRIFEYFKLAQKQPGTKQILKHFKSTNNLQNTLPNDMPGGLALPSSVNVLNRLHKIHKNKMVLLNKKCFIKKVSLFNKKYKLTNKHISYICTYYLSKRKKSPSEWETTSMLSLLNLRKTLFVSYNYAKQSVYLKKVIFNPNNQSQGNFSSKVVLANNFLKGENLTSIWIYKMTFKKVTEGQFILNDILFDIKPRFNDEIHKNRFFSKKESLEECCSLIKLSYESAIHKIERLFKTEILKKDLIWIKNKKPRFLPKQLEINFNINSLQNFIKFINIKHCLTVDDIKTLKKEYDILKTNNLISSQYLEINIISKNEKVFVNQQTENSIVKRATTKQPHSLLFKDHRDTGLIVSRKTFAQCFNNISGYNKFLKIAKSLHELQLNKFSNITYSSNIRSVLLNNRRNLLINKCANMLINVVPKQKKDVSLLPKHPNFSLIITFPKKMISYVKPPFFDFYFKNPSYSFTYTAKTEFAKKRLIIPKQPCLNICFYSKLVSSNSIALGFTWNTSHSNTTFFRAQLVSRICFDYHNGNIVARANYYSPFEGELLYTKPYKNYLELNPYQNLKTGLMHLNTLTNHKTKEEKMRMAMFKYYLKTLNKQKNVSQKAWSRFNLILTKNDLITLNYNENTFSSTQACVNNLFQSYIKNKLKVQTISQLNKENHFNKGYHFNLKNKWLVGNNNDKAYKIKISLQPEVDVALQQGKLANKAEKSLKLASTLNHFLYIPYNSNLNLKWLNFKQKNVFAKNKVGFFFLKGNTFFNTSTKLTTNTLFLNSKMYKTSFSFKKNDFLQDTRYLDLNICLELQKLHLNNNFLKFKPLLDKTKNSSNKTHETQRFSYCSLILSKKRRNLVTKYNGLKDSSLRTPSVIAFSQYKQLSFYKKQLYYTLYKSQQPMATAENYAFNEKERSLAKSNLSHKYKKGLFYFLKPIYTSPSVYVSQEIIVCNYTKKNLYLFIINLLKTFISITYPLKKLEIAPKVIKKSGQLIHMNKQKITLRLGQPLVISPRSIIHASHGDFIRYKTSVITLTYQQLKTGDIVQGIPKIEQLFEARTTKRGRLFRDNVTNLLTGLFLKYFVKSTYLLRKNMLDPQNLLNYSQFVNNKQNQTIILALALQWSVKQSFYKIQQIIVDGILRVYRSQGVSIADKHVEIIVKQMTSKVRIINSNASKLTDYSFSLQNINRGLHKHTSLNKRTKTSQAFENKLLEQLLSNNLDGPTGLFPGEIVDIDFVENINIFLLKRSSLEPLHAQSQTTFAIEPIKYEPIVLGITRASLEVESFLSAASFQQTTRVLSQAALYKKKDFLKGLKENIIIGNLIPAGTGYLS